MSENQLIVQVSALARRAAARSWRRWLIDLALIAGGVVTLVFEPFSIAIHSVVGLAFTGTVGPHLWHRRQWIAGAFRRLRRHRRLSRKLRLSVSQSASLAVLVIVMTASGLWDWLDAPMRFRVHAISGVILIVVVTWHAWTRRRWLTRRMSEPERHVTDRQPDRSSVRPG